MPTPEEIKAELVTTALSVLSPEQAAAAEADATFLLAMDMLTAMLVPVVQRVEALEAA